MGQHAAFTPLQSLIFYSTIHDSLNTDCTNFRLTHLEIFLADKNWKTGLLSSGVPLEFAATQDLVKQRFAASSDYSYPRIESGVAKEFSVDISAFKLFPLPTLPHASASLHLLVECKYRNPKVTWAFLPNIDPNAWPVIAGCTLRTIDAFSPHSLIPTPSYRLTNTIPAAYKVLEIDEGKGEATDREAKHGIDQLRYALPRLVIESIASSLNGHPDDNTPFAFCPILLTTAPLLLINPAAGLKDFLEAKDLMQLGQIHPWLILHSDNGPSFTKHAESAFAELESVEHTPRFIEIVKRRHAAHMSKTHNWRSPVEILHGFMDTDAMFYNFYFTQFIICTHSAFPDLLKKLSSTFRLMVRRSTIAPSPSGDAEGLP